MKKAPITLLSSFAIAAAFAGSPIHSAHAQGAAPKAAAPAPKAPAADTKKLVDSAAKKFKANDFKGALADYEAAESQKSSPDNIRQIALCYDKLGELSSAVTNYEKFVAVAPAASKAQAEEAKKRAEEIKAMPGKVHVESVPAGAAIQLDGKLVANAATPTEIDVPAGKHELLLSIEGHEPTKREIDVAFASKQDVSVELAKKPEPPPPPPPVAVAPPPPQPVAPAPPPPPRSKVPAYVTGGVAIVAAGVGTAFGIKALGDASDFDKNPTTSKADSGENAALIADMCIGVAVTFGVTSLVLFFTNDNPEPPKTAKVAPPAAKKAFTIVPTPVITSNGGGAGALVRF